LDLGPIDLFTAMFDFKGPLSIFAFRNKPSLAYMNKPYYCDYSGVPTIVGETRAWSFVEGTWKEINRAEAYAKARLIGEPEFRRLFGELPPLPLPIPLQ
jgi:hypothetical protein